MCARTERCAESIHRASARTFVLLLSLFIGIVAARLSAQLRTTSRRTTVSADFVKRLEIRRDPRDAWRSIVGRPGVSVARVPDPALGRRCKRVYFSGRYVRRAGDKSRGAYSRRKCTVFVCVCVCIKMNQLRNTLIRITSVKKRFRAVRVTCAKY